MYQFSAIPPPPFSKCEVLLPVYICTTIPRRSLRTFTVSICQPFLTSSQDFTILLMSTAGRVCLEDLLVHLIFHYCYLDLEHGLSQSHCHANSALKNEQLLELDIDVQYSQASFKHHDRSYHSSDIALI